MAWPLALALLPFLVAVGAEPGLGAAGARSARRRRRGRCSARVNAHMVDSVQGLRTVAAFTYGPGRLAEITAQAAR